MAPVGVSECWGTELFKDFLIRRRNREFFSLLFKAYAERSVPPYQENTVHVVLLPIERAESILQTK